MWTAVVLGILIVGGVAAYVAFAIHAVTQGAPMWPFIVGLPLAYLAVPFVFTCIWITLGWWLRAERPDDVALTWRQRLRLFANEFASLAQSAPKMVMYGVLMRDPAPAPATLPVLLLHGVGCNAGVWTGFRRYLESRKLGPVYALSYGPPLASIEHFADQLAVKIDQIQADTGAEQVVLVGHSMGGLVARAYLRKFGGARVRRLITIGTPHSGSMHAWLMTGVALAEMRPHSTFLAGLNTDVENTTGVPVISLWSWHDSMVTPQTSARLDWADNIVIAGVAHNALLNDRDVWTTVASEIEKARSNEQSVDTPRASTVH
jgi:triacylglycerol esterase/lipase EstA (alpha/beta hydrolase family)